ncbi:MAG: adenylyltransferase/cytidyltransferase family protein [Bacteroidales bacterium]|nr:adenylyltransferase/cytidyltransferase family protein [Bacteroidales bacterium]
MQVFRNIEDIRSTGPSVVAVGSFDGVHLGHRQILQLLCATAREIGGSSVVITFDPHPQIFFHPESDFFTINTLEGNLAQMEQQGVDAVLVLPFTHDLARCDYRDFLKTYVIDALHAHTLVMGPNHTIGRNQEGNHEAIEHYCAEHGVRVHPIPEYMLNQSAVHSSAIRKAILREDWETADKLLGYRLERQTIHNMQN